MMRKPPRTLKELFDMADRYTNQEDALTAERDDRPRQKEKRDIPESSKPKDRKRKAGDIVAAAEHGQPHDLHAPMISGK